MLTDGDIPAGEQPVDEGADTASLVALSGEIDLENAGEIGEDLVRSLHKGGSLVVDLSQVSFIDSTAIGMMVRVHKYAGLWRRTITWRGAQENPRRVLEITGVDQYIQLID
jgi:anti-anti-sigma factor